MLLRLIFVISYVNSSDFVYISPDSKHFVSTILFMLSN